MQASSYQFIKSETDRDGVNTITLNRPDRLNAISPAMHLEIDDALLKASEDKAIKGIILTGAGRAFCVGGDIGAMDDRAKKGSANGTVQTLNDVRARKFLNIYTNVEKPVIAAVNGDAIGLGCTIALFADIIVLSKQARLGDTHVKAGLSAGDGAMIIWPLLTSFCRAKEMLMTGRLLSADEAYGFGMANHVVEPDQVLPKALEIAGNLAHGPTLAIQYTKIGMNKILKDRIDLLMDACLAMELLTFASKDHQAAARAFMEKRKPVFTGE